MKNVNVKCNFAQVFAQYESESDVKAVANVIVAQLKKDYAARIKELGGSVSEESSASVKVEASASGKKGVKKPEKKEEKKPKTADKKKEKKVAQIALTDTKKVKAMGFKWIDYNDKCFVLSTDEDTRCLQDAMEELGGRWNGRLKGCGTGSFVFSKEKHASVVKKAMKGMYKTAKSA